MRRERRTYIGQIRGGRGLWARRKERQYLRDFVLQEPAKGTVSDAADHSQGDREDGPNNSQKVQLDPGNDWIYVYLYKRPGVAGAVLQTPL